MARPPLPAPVFGESGGLILSVKQTINFLFFWQETFVEIACRVHAASPAGDLRPAVLRLVRSGIGLLRPFQRPCYRARQRPLKRPGQIVEATPTSRKTAGLLSLRASRVNAAEKVLALKNLTQIG